jgi:hypothetical protein
MVLATRFCLFHKAPPKGTQTIQQTRRPIQRNRFLSAIGKIHLSAHFFIYISGHSGMIMLLRLFMFLFHEGSSMNQTNPYNGTKYTRLLRRKLARRSRAIEKAVGLGHATHDEARHALSQFRSIRERLNRVAA